jgi:hypothetical protein
VNPLFVTTGLALAAFWALVAAGGIVNPGYSQVEDYVSRLAAFGARWPGVGIAAIAALSTAHAAAALLVGRAGARLAGAVLGVAAACGYVVAAFRIHCPGGAAGCRAAGTAPDAWTDVVHGWAVRGYAAALVAAMVAAAAQAWSGGRRRLAALSLAAAGASVVTVLRIADPAGGADQRLWLLVSTLWLLVVTGGLSRRSGGSG